MPTLSINSTKMATDQSRRLCAARAGACGGLAGARGGADHGPVGWLFSRLSAGMVLLFTAGPSAGAPFYIAWSWRYMPRSPRPLTDRSQARSRGALARNRLHGGLGR